MYDEESYKFQILWIKIKRIIIISIYTLLGIVVGVLLSFYVMSTLNIDSKFRIPILVIPILFFFATGFLVTTSMSKEIQDSYWRMAVLRKMTLISKKLDSLTALEKQLSNKTTDNKVTKIKKTKKVKKDKVS